MSERNEKIIEEFRAAGGKVGGMFANADLALLTVTGARTGKRRTTPVGYLRDGDRVLVFASNLGAPDHPAWYRNLVANPQVTVEIGDGRDVESYEATAWPLRGEERDRLYERQAARVPAFADHQSRTARVIPVVALYRRDASRARAIGDELVRIHDRLRQDLADLLTEVDGFVAASDAAGARASTAGPPTTQRWPGLGAQLRERCLTVCGDVHAHHDNEAGRGFPLLERRFPELAPILDRFRREHDALARFWGRIADGVADLATGDPIAIRDDLRHLAAELAAHFDREERELVPALNLI